MSAVCLVALFKIASLLGMQAGLRLLKNVESGHSERIFCGKRCDTAGLSVTTGISRPCLYPGKELTSFLREVALCCFPLKSGSAALEVWQGNQHPSKGR